MMSCCFMYNLQKCVDYSFRIKDEKTNKLKEAVLFSELLLYNPEFYL